ncbi:MAG: hypothetical protein U5Q03_02550 [Bacteroidota bacterium]|nr:hypothetical protein [Bacteroidota bacterium]
MKKFTQLTTLFFVVLAFTVTGHVNGQTYSESFMDGEILFKVQQ